MCVGQMLAGNTGTGAGGGSMVGVYKEGRCGGVGSRRRCILCKSLKLLDLR